MSTSKLKRSLLGFYSLSPYKYVYVELDLIFSPLKKITLNT